MPNIPPANQGPPGGPQVIQGQNINQPYLVNGVIMQNPQMSIIAPFYPLQRFDYELLAAASKLGKWVEYFASAAVALFVNMMGKLIYSNISDKVTFEEWEFFAWLATSIIALIIMLVDQFVPNERKALKKKIRRCFK